MKDIVYEIIGSILIIREQTDESKLTEFSNRMMQKYPSISTVTLQTSKVGGFERTRKLEHFMGNKTFETVYKEYGNSYLVDISTSFFSPRLSFERQRIAKLVTKGEKILNFFSGVGPFSIAIATNCNDCIVYSIELNTNAYQYLVRNIELNKCVGRVEAYLGDAFNVVPKLFNNKMDRILLPLPLEAEKSLPIAYKALKNGKGNIHWQITEKTSNKEINNQTFENRVDEILNRSQISSNFQIESSRLIRWLAPRVAHRAIDLVFN